MAAPAYLAPPPRPVPLLLQGAVLCGGTFSQLGWLFLGIGLFIGTMFAPIPRTASYLLYILETKTVTGIVTDSGPTRMTRGGARGRGSGRRVYFTKFSFDVDGKPYSGVSYEMFPSGIGMAVTVEYPAGFPSAARVRGMSPTPAGPYAALVYIFAAIGLMIVLRGFRRGLPALPLLASGALTSGKLEDRKRTNMTINRRQIYRLTYSFTAPGGPYQVVTSDEYQTKFDDENETVLYDPQNPAQAVVLKGLPCSVTFDQSGNPAASAFEAVMSLVIPAVAIVGNLAFSFLA